MLILTAYGPLAVIKAAADAFDDDTACADAVSWFEEDAGRFKLEIYAEDEDDADACRAVILAASAELNVNIAPVQDADWVAMALDGLPAVRAGRFVVAGAHALARNAGGRTAVWIEASEAFGTGHHGTTLGCLLALERILRQRRVRRVLDVGAGSGVLAIAAAKTGAFATAVEIDRRAAEIMGENIANNRIRPRVRAIAGDGGPVARRLHRRCDLVFANILFRPLIAMREPIAGAVAPGGRLVLSGLLRTQAPLVKLAYRGQGLRVIGHTKREGWATLEFERGRSS
ncbi:MAG: 50S ribosomal protein L11 methyltransferase [Caulobacterales bacterium]|jgi:ribosomal protein L11 methyltransferase